MLYADREVEEKMREWNIPKKGMQTLKSNLKLCNLSIEMYVSEWMLS